MKKFWRDFVKGYRVGVALREFRKQEALSCTVCDLGHPFNARWQSGICPHLRIIDGDLQNPLVDLANAFRNFGETAGKVVKNLKPLAKIG